MQRRLPTQTGIIEFEMLGGHRESSHGKLGKTCYAFCKDQGDRLKCRSSHYVGVPTASLNGLRVFVAQGEPPAEVLPPPSPRKYWTGRGIAERLVELGALPPGTETARCASHVLPNRDFWEAIRVPISANILI
jgi:hypothetical protein